MKKPAAAIALLMLLALQRKSFADSPATLPPTEPIDTSTVELFPKGMWTTTMYGGFFDQPGHHREQAGNLTLGVGYYLWDNFSLNGELTGIGASQSGGGASAGGANLLIRHHLYNGSGWTFFWDFGVGILEADKRIPPGGTDFNYSIRTGPGITYRIDSHLDLLAGARYLHISNARQEGLARNPSINAGEAYIGVLYRL
jgi:hypothetical protein